MSLSRRNSYNGSYAQVMQLQRFLRTVDPVGFSEDAVIAHDYSGYDQEERIDSQKTTNFFKEPFSQGLISSELPGSVSYYAISQQYESPLSSSSKEEKKPEEHEIIGNHFLYMRGLEITNQSKIMEKEIQPNQKVNEALSQEALISPENLRKEAFAAIKNKQLEWLAVILGIGQSLEEAKEEYHKQCFSILSFKKTLDCITAVVKAQLEHLVKFNNSVEKDLKNLANAISQTTDISIKDKAIEEFKNAFDQWFHSIPPTIILNRHINNIEKIIDLYRINIEDAEIPPHEWIKLYQTELQELEQLQQKWPLARETASQSWLQIKTRWNDCRKYFFELYKQNQLPEQYVCLMSHPERLFEASWNVNIPDKKQGSLLCYALAQDNPGAVSLLLRRGADPLQSNEQQLSALHLAIDKPNSLSHQTLITWVRRNSIEKLWPLNSMLFAYIPPAFKAHLEILKENMDRFLDSLIQSTQLSSAARFFLLEWDLSKRVQEWEIYLSLMKEGVISGKIDELPTHLQEYAKSMEQNIWRIWKTRLGMHQTVIKITQPAKEFVADNENKRDFSLARLPTEQKAIAVIDHFSSMGSLVTEQTKKRIDAEEKLQVQKVLMQQNRTQYEQEQLRRLVAERKVQEEKAKTEKLMEEKRLLEEKLAMLNSSLPTAKK